MSDFKLLLVEDNAHDINLCKVCIEDFQKEKNCSIELIECKSVDEAFKKLDNSFDGAIIDLKLSTEGDEGNQVVSRIEEMHLRIPVAILTGTPSSADSDFTYIGVFKKGEEGAGYADLLEHFWGIHNTGLTRIMGGRGIIEKTLSEVFLKNLLPNRKKWVEYGGKEPSRTERALLRHALSHLLQLLDDDGDLCFPEEVYLSPPLTDKIKTGSIIKKKGSGNSFVVLNPACDLVIRTKTNNCKTDRILIVEIEKEQDILLLAMNGIVKTDKRKAMQEKVFTNKYTEYHHWLPRTDFFEGGFLNFRKLTSLPNDEFIENFEKPEVQISPLFVKDMVARFSAYYARQGQPDVDFKSFITLAI